MTTKKFIIKIIVKTILFVVFTTIVFTLANSPIIANSVAMGQMQNSNDYYILMELYNNTKHYVSIIYNCITVFFTGTIIYDVYQFIKTKTKENN